MLIGWTQQAGTVTVDKRKRLRGDKMWGTPVNSLILILTHGFPRLRSVRSINAGADNECRS